MSIDKLITSQLFKISTNIIPNLVIELTLKTYLQKFTLVIITFIIIIHKFLNEKNPF